HLYHNVTNKRNTFLIVGYCAPHTPGAVLRSGAKEVHVFGDALPVRAQIEAMDSFSAHAGSNELARFLDNQRGQVKRLFLVHGTLPRQEALRDFLTSKGFPEADIPELGQEYGI
ncbi:MBL fold metallo-hydrolase RNA specificity domain-containing protein, partial [Arthrospira platensis SPKY1]|nr:MBL fold metallo-hydrolase RNA specificity domain-containing protein [Arthrospira platensis SPKY1]